MAGLTVIGVTSVPDTGFLRVDSFPSNLFAGRTIYGTPSAIRPAYQLFWRVIK